MAREVITRVWCDLCLGEDQHTEAAATDHVAITAPGRVIKPLSLDLCELHRKELLGPVVEALEEFGAPVDGTTPPPRKGAKFGGLCKVPGCDSNRGRGFKSHASFSAHVRQHHGLTIGGYRDQYGPEGAAPDDLDSAAEVDPPLEFNVGEEFKCPDCPKVYSTELGNHRPAQALGVHRAKVHGYRAVS